MAFNIGIFSLGLFLFCLATVISKIQYKSNFGLTYSFKNYFPFEFNYKTGFVGNAFGNILYILSMVSISCFYLFFKTDINYEITKICSVFGILLSVFSIILLFIPFNYGKTHVAVFSFAGAFSAILSSSIVFVTYQFYNTFRTTPLLVCFIIEMIITIFSFGILLNPKLTFRFKGELIKDENGKDQVKRPKWIVFAFTEWLFFLILFADALLFLITICCL